MDRLERIARSRTTHHSPTMTNTFSFRSLEEYQLVLKGGLWLPNYTRVPHSHPDNLRLEQAITKLEDADDTLVFDSGMSAIFTVLTSLLRPGDSWILTIPCYTKTYQLSLELTKFGIKTKYLNLHALGHHGPTEFSQALRKLTDESTKLIFAETPANPHTYTIPMWLFSEFGCVSVVDNTLASPAIQKPLNSGCPVVVESLTKYFSKGEFMGGSVSWNERRLQTKLNNYPELRGRKILDIFGAFYVSPLAPCLAKRCLKNMYDLEERVNKASESAVRLALLVESMGFQTYYPGLESHPQHLTARSQTPVSYGCIVTFDIGDGDKASAFAKRLAKKIPLAVSLGSPTTMFQSPAVMTHGTIPEKERLEMGITDGLFRISCGTEETRWILETFEKALKPFAP